MMGSNSMRAAALMTGRTSLSGPAAPRPGGAIPGVVARGGDIFVIAITHAAEAVPVGWRPS
jgi:hypothetical protein